jgi:hypothetical protein
MTLVFTMDACPAHLSPDILAGAWWRRLWLPPQLPLLLLLLLRRLPRLRAEELITGFEL